jgi:GDP-4-dehydro-6-deoxy-D-mannose reductase
LKSALVTGAAGFVGKHLARELAAAGWRVFGFGLTGTAGNQPPLAGVVTGDVTDARAVRDAIRMAQPDAVFHLAGVSSVAAAERDPAAAFHTNCIGAVVVLREAQAYRVETGKQPVCLVVGSAEQYGSHPADAMPLVETAAQRPVTTYAASKCAQEVAALQLHRASGLPVVLTRSFNHSGAGQAGDFLVPALVSRALGLKAAGGGNLAVGNTTPVRDYLHVDDVVRSYRLLVERGAPGEVYNVSSGTGLSVRDIAMRVIKRVGVRTDLEVRPELVRNVDIERLVGDNSRLRGLGWRPEKTFDDIVGDLIVAAA